MSGGEATRGMRGFKERRRRELEKLSEERETISEVGL